MLPVLRDRLKKQVEAVFGDRLKCWRLIIKYLKKNEYDHIVVTQLASLTAIWAVAYMQSKGMIHHLREGNALHRTPVHERMTLVSA